MAVADSAESVFSAGSLAGGLSSSAPLTSLVLSEGVSLGFSRSSLVSELLFSSSLFVVASGASEHFLSTAGAASVLSTDFCFEATDFFSLSDDFESTASLDFFS